MKKKQLIRELGTLEDEWWLIKRLKRDGKSPSKASVRSYINKFHKLNYSDKLVDRLNECKALVGLKLIELRDLPAEGTEDEVERLDAEIDKLRDEIEDLVIIETKYKVRAREMRRYYARHGRFPERKARNMAGQLMRPRSRTTDGSDRALYREI